MNHLTPEEFGTAFDELFRHSAFRLELLDRYVAENEADPFRRFLAGEPQDPAWREPWKEFVRESLQAGKQMARVHVVSEPLSDYLRFQLTCGYPASVEAGEQVRILQEHGGLTLPFSGGDYWLFDDHAVLMDYEKDGTFTGAEIISDPSEVEYYRQVRDLALQSSVPLTDYLASLSLRETV